MGGTGQRVKGIISTVALLGMLSAGAQPLTVDKVLALPFRAAGGLLRAIF